MTEGFLVPEAVDSQISGAVCSLRPMEMDGRTEPWFETTVSVVETSSDVFPLER